MTAGYEANKRWRQKNRARFDAGKARNYAQTRDGAVNSRKEWTTADLAKITAEGRPTDRELAAELGRSAAAIQQARARATR